MKATQWTFFLDLLGFSEANKNVTSDEKAQELINFLNSNKEILEKQNSHEVIQRYSRDLFDLYKLYEIKYAIISDSIIITLKPKEVANINRELLEKHSVNALLIMIMRIQLLIANCLYQMGFFIRGGVSNSYCDIQGNTGSGLGLINAHEAESKIAKYPRIALSKDISIDTIRRANWLFSTMYSHNKLIYKENDEHFINTLEFMAAQTDATNSTNLNAIKKHPTLYMQNCEVTRNFLSIQREKILEYLNNHKSAYKSLPPGKEKSIQGKIAKKYMWLKKNHNKTIKSRNKLAEFKIP
ncbi:hypothetical protein [Pseudomonas alcaligenes]|uniref:hypothetical protein n=1 Tax=Aquipseudomonas alcaligenes TaxID=43263 RepID=UPI00358E856C